MASPSIDVPRRSEKLDLRVSPADKARLQAAAAATQRSLSDFVLQSALTNADSALADRRFFFLDEERWAAFQFALDAPPRPLPRLQSLLEKPSFFDSESVK